jgi:succinate dehydrogenase / fumarate reductase iron-sulfur subunit
MRGKMTPQKLLLHQHKAPAGVKKLFDTIDGREERNELNLYVSGYEDDPAEQEGKDTETAAAKDQGQPEADGAAGREPPTEGSQPGTTEGEGTTEGQAS